MREITDDPFYETLDKLDTVVDYCLIEDDAPHQGARSHKDAVLFAMLKMIERYIDEQLKSEIKYYGEARGEPFPWNLDIGKAKAAQIDAGSLLFVPDITHVDYHGNRTYDCKWKNAGEDRKIPYWYALLEPPHSKQYEPDDFRQINSVLFPGGAETLEVYEWTTDWSNYYDDGHEWWGAGCWSVYDRHLGRYVVIMASATD